MPPTPPLSPLGATALADPLWTDLRETERDAIGAAYDALAAGVAAAGPAGLAFLGLKRRQAIEEQSAYDVTAARHAAAGAAREAFDLVAQSYANAPSGTLASLMSGALLVPAGTLLADLVLQVIHGPHAGTSFQGASIPLVAGPWYTRVPLTVGELQAGVRRGLGVLGWSGRTEPANDPETALFPVQVAYPSRHPTLPPVFAHLMDTAMRSGRVMLLPSGLRVLPPGTPALRAPEGTGEGLLGADAGQTEVWDASLRRARAAWARAQAGNVVRDDAMVRDLLSHGTGRMVYHDDLEVMYAALQDLRRRAAARIRRGPTVRRAPRPAISGMTLQAFFESSALDHVPLSDLKARVHGEAVHELHFYAWEREARHRSGGTHAVAYRPETESEIRALYRAGRLFFQTPAGLREHSISSLDDVGRTSLLTRQAGVVCVIKSASGKISRTAALPSEIIVER